MLAARNEYAYWATAHFSSDMRYRLGLEPVDPVWEPWDEEERAEQEECEVDGAAENGTDPRAEQEPWDEQEGGAHGTDPRAAPAAGPRGNRSKGGCISFPPPRPRRGGAADLAHRHYAQERPGGGAAQQEPPKFRCLPAAAAQQEPPEQGTEGQIPAGPGDVVSDTLLLALTDAAHYAAEEEDAAEEGPHLRLRPFPPRRLHQLPAASSAPSQKPDAFSASVKRWIALLRLRPFLPLHRKNVFAGGEEASEGGQEGQGNGGEREREREGERKGGQGQGEGER